LCQKWGQVQLPPKGYRYATLSEGLGGYDF
jgi:hypothetical protein